MTKAKKHKKQTAKIETKKVAKTTQKKHRHSKKINNNNKTSTTHSGNTFVSGLITNDFWQQYQSRDQCAFDHVVFDEF